MNQKNNKCRYPIQCYYKLSWTVQKKVGKERKNNEKFSWDSTLLSCNDHNNPHGSPFIGFSWGCWAHLEAETHRRSQSDKTNPTLKQYIRKQHYPLQSLLCSHWLKISNFCYMFLLLSLQKFIAYSHNPNENSIVAGSEN